MILYHGSNMAIPKIDLRLGNPNKDFGKGFYLTEDEDQARRILNHIEYERHIV